MKILKVRSLIALLAAFLMVLGSGLAISAASATDGTKPVSAKVSSFYNHECNSSQWQFVITQVKDEASAPDTISVTWANGSSQTVTRDTFTGGTAHYITTSNLESSVVSATMNIYLEWGGEFNLSDGPCDATPPPDDTTPEGSNNSSSPSCEKIMVGQPTGVQPEDATVVVKLDGVPTMPGTYPTTPGTHVVTTEVNGTEVDSDSVDVAECAPPPPTKPEGSVVVVSNDCETITFSSKDVKPEDAAVIYMLDGVVKPAGTYDVTPGQHTVELYVNGDKVDSKTVTVEECKLPPPPPVDDEKVTLCHATGSATNPFVQITVAAAGAFNGHYGADHQGGRDIIPPFTYQDQTYSQNWDAAGQAVYNNGCEVAPPPPTKPEGSVVVVSNDCETITFSSKDVKPEDAAVIYMLDGVVKPAGTYDVTPGQHTVELYVNGDKVDSKTVTVEECKLPPPPPGDEADNTYAASANGCDDLLTGEGDASVTATFTNTDDDTDKADVVGARLVDLFGQTYGTQPAVSVPDGSSQDYVFTGLNGGDYSVEFVDGDGNVIKTVDVFVDYCELPPLEEGDATAHGICHAAVVNSNEDATGEVLYGDFDELNPDGQTTVAPNGTVKLPTRRLELDIVVFFDNGRYSRFDNIKVKQHCGHHGHHVPPPPHTPPHPHHPGNGTPPPSWVPPTTPVVSVTPATPATPVAPTAVTAFSDTGVAAPQTVRSSSPLVGVGVFGLGLLIMLVAARGNLTSRRRKHVHI